MTTSSTNKNTPAPTPPPTTAMLASELPACMRMQNLYA